MVIFKIFCDFRKYSGDFQRMNTIKVYNN